MIVIGYLIISILYFNAAFSVMNNPSYRRSKFNDTLYEKPIAIGLSIIWPAHLCLSILRRLIC